MQKIKVILTTPDYPPKLGGLSTFSRNLNDLLLEMNLDVEIMQWNTKTFVRSSRFLIPKGDLYIHVHFMAGMLGQFPPEKSVNFCHGSEILFTSPNPIKKIIKKLGKFKGLDYFEKSLCNFFISNFTRKKLCSLGLKNNYGRDFVVHNNIRVNMDITPSIKKYGDNGRIRVCSIARDVPHKNLKGAYMFCLLLHKFTDFQVEFHVTSKQFTSKVGVEVFPLTDKSDEEIQEVYKNSDLNLLLSKDHSEEGFFEGFGLTVLEAAQYGVPSVVSNTGGLAENVHHLYNGYVLSEVTEKTVQDFHSQALDNFEKWSVNAYSHLSSSHQLETYKKIISKILEAPRG